MREIILESTSPTCGSELDDLKKELKKPFFAMGMTDVAIKLAALRLKALRNQLPASERGGDRKLLRQLLKKFPSELADEAKRYIIDMNKADVCNQPYEWSYTELVAMLSSHITSASPSAEANAADVPHGGGGGGAPGTTDFDGCLNCGSNDHSTRKCTAKPCAYCGLRFCFGARVRGPKPGCLAKKVVEGGEISTTDLGLNGRPLNVYLTGQIKDKAEVIKARAANATKEANAAVQTDPKIKNVIDPDDYANESDCCEMLFASQVCC